MSQIQCHIHIKMTFGTGTSPSFSSLTTDAKYSLFFCSDLICYECFSCTRANVWLSSLTCLKKYLLLLPLPFAGCCCASFWFALYLLFCIKLSGYTHFACLDKNDFSRHKKNGSLKSEYQYLIWDLDLIRFEALCFLLDRDVLFGLTGCRDTRFSRVMHFSGQNPSQVGMDFAWLGLQGSAPSPVEGRNIPLASCGCFGRCLGEIPWEPHEWRFGARLEGLWCSRPPQPSCLCVCLGGPVAMEKLWELSAWLAWLFS